MTPPDDQAEALSDFLGQHMKPYDPATDDYERPPFAADVISPGRSDFYNFHYYLVTKVPPESIVGLIRHYTGAGDLVFDPFCGSGMTGVAVQMHNQESHGEQRYCILKDLSPAACHIAKGYTSPAEAGSLRQEYERIAQRLDQEEQRLYSTDHFERASGLYSTDSDLVRQALGFSSGTGLFGDTPHSTLPEARWQVVTEETVAEYLGYAPSFTAESKADREWVRILARMVYVVWSDVYKCEGFKTVQMPTGRVNPRTGRPVSSKARVLRGCGREIIARGTDDKSEDDGNNAFIRCPHCQERWMKGRVPRLRVTPVEECYEYPGFVAGKTGLSVKLLRAKRPISRRQAEFVSKLCACEIPSQFPDPRLDKSNPRYRRDSLAGKKIETYRDFFTHRNLWAVSAIWQAIQLADQQVQGALRFCFTSQIMRCSRLRRMKGDKPGEQLSGTLHIASETVETNVFKVFSKAVRDYYESVASASAKDSVNPFVRLGTATDMSDVPGSSIDYIFTDSPFGSNIYYSGVTFMQEAWLGQLTYEPLEAIMHRKVDGGYKRLDDYAGLMQKAFTEMFRVLKPVMRDVVDSVE